MLTRCGGYRGKKILSVEQTNTAASQSGVGSPKTRGRKPGLNSKLRALTPEATSLDWKTFIKLKIIARHIWQNASSRDQDMDGMSKRGGRPAGIRSHKLATYRDAYAKYCCTIRLVLWVCWHDKRRENGCIPKIIKYVCNSEK